MKHEFYLDYDSFPIMLSNDSYRVLETRVKIKTRGLITADDKYCFMHLVERVK